MPENILDLLERFGPECAANAIGERLSTQDLGDSDDALRLVSLMFVSEIWDAIPFDLRRTTLEIMLDVVAAFGQRGWNALSVDDDFDRIAVALDSSDASLPAAEQLAYAPEGSVWRSLGLATLEQIGMYAQGGTRDAERLLHDLGATPAAYRVESSRKRRFPRKTGGEAFDSDARSNLTTLANQQIVLAGGHPALRSAAKRALKSDRISVREIPSKYEAVRREREIDQLVAGSTLVVIIIRQIAHATSDLVIQAARKHNVPVVLARTPSLAGIRNALLGAVD